MKIGPDIGHLVPRHLEDAELVAYLDGELVDDAQPQARAHLESCWPCRSRLNAVQDSIGNFLRVRQSLLPEEVPPSGPAVEQFRGRLAQHRQVSDVSSLSFKLKLWEWRARWRLAWSVLEQHQRPVVALVVAGILLAVVVADPFQWTVSADAILSRASAYELLHVRLASDVVRSSVRVERVELATQTVTPIGQIEMAEDCLSSDIYIVARSSSGQWERETVEDFYERFTAFPFDSQFEQPLLQYVTARQWFPDVSISEYRKLIAGRGDDQAFAARRGGVFELRHPFAPAHESGIIETSLRLDAATYAPLQVNIVAAHGDAQWEYRLIRTSFEFVTRTPELARLFSGAKSDAPLLRTRTPLPSGSAAMSASARPRPLSYFNSKATDAEVAAAAALHELDACLGEEINVFPMTDGSLLVQGLVDWPRRKEAIERALRALNRPPQVEMYTPVELQTGVALYDPPDRMPENQSPPATERIPMITLGNPSGGTVPMYDRLFEHFQARATASGSPVERTDIQRQVAAFCNQVVTLSQQALLHAWALRRLDIEFSPPRVTGLSASALQQVDRMRTDHRQWIRKTSSRLIDMISPVAPESVGSSAGQVSQQSAALLQRVIEQNDLVRALFASSARASNPGADVTRLVALLQQIR